MTSAFADFGGGLAGYIDVKSSADFQVAQLENMKILSSARASREMASINREFSQQLEANIASAAVSGLDTMSFASVNEGNIEEEGRLKKAVLSDLNVEKGQLTIEQMAASIAGKQAARAALFSGILSGAQTLTDANEAYKANHLGETRGQYFKRAVRRSWFKDER